MSYGRFEKFDICELMSNARLMKFVHHPLWRSGGNRHHGIGVRYKWSVTVFEFVKVWSSTSLVLCPSQVWRSLFVSRPSYGSLMIMDRWSLKRSGVHHFLRSMKFDVEFTSDAEARKHHYDLRVKSEQFKAGEWVYFHYPRRFKSKSFKWQKSYTGPYLIVRLIEPVNCVL